MAARPGPPAQDRRADECRLAARLGQRTDGRRLHRGFVRQRQSLRVFAVAQRPVGTTLNESMYTTKNAFARFL